MFKMEAMLQKIAMPFTVLLIVKCAQQLIQLIFQLIIFYAHYVMIPMVSIPKQNNVCNVLELITISWIVIKYTALLVHQVAKLAQEV